MTDETETAAVAIQRGNECRSRLGRPPSVLSALRILRPLASPILPVNATIPARAWSASPRLCPRQPSRLLRCPEFNSGPSVRRARHRRRYAMRRRSPTVRCCLGFVALEEQEGIVAAQEKRPMLPLKTREHPWGWV